MLRTGLQRVVAGLVGLLLLTSGCQMMPQPSQTTSQTTLQRLSADDWGPRVNTPSIQFSVIEVKRTALITGSTMLLYSPAAGGLPPGRTVTLWLRRFDGTTLEIRTAEVNSAGTVALPDIALTGYVKGEPLEVAIMSADKTVKAFAKVTPFPIESTQGRCRLWLELASGDGMSFIARVEGFEPNEEVTVISQSDGETIETSRKLSTIGAANPTVLFPGVIGKEDGTARYTVVGRACNVSVEYDWGRKAATRAQ